MKLLGNGIILTDADLEPSWRIIGELLEQRAELLEALKEIEDVASFIPIEDRRDRRQLGEALDKARAAIAKAEAAE